MKLKYEFVIRKVGGTAVAMAVGTDNVAFNGMVKLNTTAEFIFSMLNAGETTMDDIVAAMVKEYDIDENTARDAAESFIGGLRGDGLIAE
ncbi:MAG: PqqD family protein [Clostridia bacterium]|nr:PqqD family protein [Clostridia bacterium]